MRDIKFRGKRTDNGEWVYGVPTKDGRGEMVMVENIFECEEYNCRGANCLYVDENTVGQYTGLKDKNGTKIFEGDMISTDLERPYNIVEYRNGCFMLNCYDGKPYYDIMFSTSDELNAKCDYTEVIGNIYDNPELLGGKR